MWATAANALRNYYAGKLLITAVHLRTYFYFTLLYDLADRGGMLLSTNSDGPVVLGLSPTFYARF